MKLGRPLRQALNLVATILCLFLTGHERSRRARTPRVEFEGCDVVLTQRGDVACTFPKFSIFDLPKLSAEEWQSRAGGRGPDLRRMTLWVEGPWESYEARADGRSVGAVPWQTPSGTRVSLRVPVTTRTLTLELEGEIVYRLSLLPAESPKDQSGLDDVMALWRTDRPAAEEALLPLLSNESAPVRAKAVALFARAELRRGYVESGVASLYQAMSAAEEAGLLSDWVASGLVLARTLIEDERQIVEATEVLDHLAKPLSYFPVGRAMEPYYRALLWSTMGHLHSARTALELSKERAERLDLKGHLPEVYQKLMDVYDLLGLHEQSSAQIEAQERLALNAGPCQEAQREANMGWHALISGRGEDALGPSERALDLLSKVTRAGRPGCDSPLMRVNVLLNLAQALLEAGRLDDAEKRLNALRLERVALPPRLTAWRPLLEGRLALHRGQWARAVLAHEEAASIAAIERLPYAESAALYGRAEAIEALGTEADAREAYARAEDALRRWGTLIPFGGGLQSFFGKHDRGAQRHLALLLRNDTDPSALSEAACLARKNLARIPASVAEERRRHGPLGMKLEARLRERPPGVPTMPAEDARERRCSSSEYASAPIKGEVMMVIHPIEETSRASRKKVAPLGQAWAVMVLTSAGVKASIVRGIPDQLPIAVAERRSLASALLEPFAEDLARVAAEVPSDQKPLLRVAAAESLSLLPIHELPWGDEPDETLSDSFSVVYTIDVPNVERLPTRRGRGALIVVDPSSSLVKADEEAKVVAAALEARGLVTIVLTGEDATKEVVRSTLARDDIELLHYIGHGHAGEREGFDDSLDLAFDERLTITDIFDVGHAPRYVTLSVCRGAASRPGSHVRGMSLASAFLVMGAEVVVASHVDVTDGSASAVMSELYNDVPSFLADPSSAVNAARRRVSDRENADFRVLVR